MLKSLFSVALLLGLTALPVFATNPTVDRLTDQLIEAQSAGDEEAQEKLLNQLLKQDPKNVEGYRLLGVLLEQQGRFKEAIALYQTGIKNISNNAFLYEMLTSILVRNGETTKVIELLKQGIQNNPDNLTLYRLLGLRLKDANRTDEAIALFRQALKFDDSEVIFFYQSLGEWLGEDDPNGAIALLQEGLKRKPEDIAFHSLMPVLANLLSRQNRLPEAIRLYQEGIRRRPDELTSYFGFAYFLTTNNRRDEAIALYQEVIQRHPKESSFYTLLGELYEQQNQADKAIALYQTGIRKAENPETLYQAWGDLLSRRGKTEQAIAIYREGIRRNPSGSGLYSSLARILEENQRIDEVVALYQQSFKQEGLDYRLQLSELADLLVRQKQVDRMIAVYQDAMQRKPDDRDLLQQVGDFLVFQSRAKEAEPIYRRIIQLHPKVAQFAEILDYLRLASILSQQARGTEAIAITDKAIQLSRRDRSALFFSYLARGWIQVQEQQFAQATRSVQQAASLNDRVPEANCLLGGLLALQNQPEQAIATYRKLLIEPNEEVVRSPICTIMGVALLQPDQFAARIAALRQNQAVYFGNETQAIDPEAIVHNATGEVLQHQGKIREAIAEYEKAIQIDSEFAIASQNLQRARALMR
ncbi:TPR repeat-containing protein [Leptolyngbya sp. NIES-3755]|nr:TPR repeat-containing protein [Leptolyngbya sp. NIES-3755]